MSAKVFLLLLALQCLAVNLSHEVRDWFIFEGTKWCGQGSLATSYDDLGKHREVDKCCREHDKHCEARIHPLTKKYRTWNISLKTASHCKCEVRFKKCLQKVNNTASRQIENLYFNFIEPHCIRFKKVNVCVRRSWWICVKEKQVTKAYFVQLKKALG